MAWVLQAKSSARDRGDPLHLLDRARSFAGRQGGESGAGRRDETLVLKGEIAPCRRQQARRADRACRRAPSSRGGTSRRARRGGGRSDHHIARGMLRLRGHIPGGCKRLEALRVPLGERCQHLVGLGRSEPARRCDKNGHRLGPRLCGNLAHASAGVGQQCHKPRQVPRRSGRGCAERREERRPLRRADRALQEPEPWPRRERPVPSRSRPRQCRRKAGARSPPRPPRSSPLARRSLTSITSALIVLVQAPAQLRDDGGRLGELLESQVDVEDRPQGRPRTIGTVVVSAASRSGAIALARVFAARRACGRSRKGPASDRCPGSSRARSAMRRLRSIRSLECHLMLV